MENTCIFTSELSQLQGYLRSLAWNYTKNENDANDLIQDTMCRAIEKTKYYKRGTNFKAWISVVMRNIFINGYRKKRRYNIVSIEESPQFLSDYDVDSGAEYNLFSQEINSAIEQLNPKSQEIIGLCRAGLSYKEMAENLNLPLGTIKSRIHMARKALQTELKKLNHAA